MSTAAWTERLAERSPSVQRSRARSVEQAQVLVDAAKRLITRKGETFTTQELIREAGVALQTFYRYFGGKDELLLAVLEDMVADASVLYATRAEAEPDPVARLRSYVTSILEQLDRPENAAMRRWVAAEHWRLSQLQPSAVALATKPMMELLERDIAEATARGLLHSPNPTRDAWFLNQLLLSVFHHHSFAASHDPTIAEDLWQFALRALGGDR